MFFDKISSCYYPTRILLLDDNKKFLEAVSTYLGSDQQLVQFTDPLAAAEFLNKQLPKQMDTNKWMSHSDEYATNISNIAAHSTVDVNTFLIHQEIYNPKRFDDIAVLVVDYAMPGQNGIEFCRQFKNNPVKKILITGEATLSVAVDAFNEGIIDKFIVKDYEKNFYVELKNVIAKLKLKYFQDISKTIINHLSSTDNNPFKDQTFIKQYEELLRSFNFIEYYMIDTNGSLLFLDENAKPSWLLIQTEDDITNYFHIANSSDDCDHNILEALKTKNKMVYFFSPKDYTTSASGWSKYLHSIKCLSGDKNNYYYNFVNEPSVYDKSLKVITSYRQYLANKHGEWN